MFSQRSPTWPLAIATLVLATLQTPAMTSAQTPHKTKPAPKAQAAQPEPAVEWLKDDQGREYRLEPLPKNQGQKISDDRVRTMWGVQADLAKEDEQFFYIKIYRADAPAPATPSAATAKPAGSARKTPAEPVAAPSRTLSWTPYGTGLPTGGQWREGIAIVDMTGDGRPEIVASPARKTLRPPTVFAYDGTTWAASKAFTFPARPYDYGTLAVGDVNRDGTPDLVLGVHLRGLMALRSTAASAATVSATATAPAGTRVYEDASTGLPFATRGGDPIFSSRAVQLLDCNGDGRLDIVALGEGPRLPTPGGQDINIATGVASYLQEADGSWTAKLQTDRAGVFGSSMASGDIDGDGKIDLVIAPGTFGDTRLFQRGDGACGWTPEAVSVIRPRSYVTSVAAADVNADGRAEVLVGYTDFAQDPASFGIDLLTRASDGAWTRAALLRESGRGRIEAITTGDVNGDGKIDVAAVDGSGEVRVLLGDGRGGFTREQQELSSATHCAGGAIAIGDLDRDGLGDIVVGFATEASTSTPGTCPSEGGIAAWKTQRAGAGTRHSSAPAGTSRRN